jgi:hypothetical protein
MLQKLQDMFLLEAWHKLLEKYGLREKIRWMKGFES